MSAPPPSPQGSRISPINPQLATAFLPTAQSTSVDSRFIYAPWNGQSTHAPQGSPRSIPFHDQRTYAPQEYRIWPINARPVTFAPPTPQTNPYNDPSAYAQLNGNPTYTQQGPPQSDSFNDPSTYALMNGHSTYASREYWIPPINAQPEAFASPTPQSNQLIGHPSYIPHTLSASRGVPAHMSGLITSNISDSNDSTRSRGIQNHDLSDVRDNYHWGARIPGLSSAYSSGHATYPQQQMNGRPQSTPHIERPSKCDQCLRSFMWNYQLERHQRSAHLERPFKCYQCSGSFKRNCDLEKHMRKAHLERPFKCIQCTGSFKRNRDLEKHQSEAHAEGPFKCEQCPERFTQILDLEKHQKSHPEAYLRCDQCSQTFVLYRDLIRHQRTHVEGDLKCDQCPEKFIFDHDLTRHQRIHLENEKYFKCDQCPKNFKHKRDLKRHSQKHFVVDPIRCLNCGNGYSRIDSLKTHMEVSGCGMSSDPKH